MNPLMIWNEPGVEIIWKVISFFASEPERQISMIGPTKDWFLKEDMKEHPGANYLLGMAFVYCEYMLFMHGLVTSTDYEEYSGLLYTWDDYNDDYNQDMIFKDINNQLEKMKGKKKCWSVHALAEDEDWRHLRELSKKVLDLYELDLNPTLEAFWFPDILHIDHWGDPEGRASDQFDWNPDDISVVRQFILLRRSSERAVRSS